METGVPTGATNGMSFLAGGDSDGFSISNWKLSPLCIMDEKRCLCVCLSIVMLIVETVFSIIPFPHVVSFLICIISALVYDSCMWLFLSMCVWLGLHIPAWNSREVAPDTGAKSRTRLGVGKLRLFWSPNIFVERQDGYIICQAFRPWNVNGQIELGHECV